jgi:phosphatidylserine decarboxylase
MRFAREAWPFVLPFVVLAPVLWWLAGPAWGLGSLLMGLLVLLFFRDPRRTFDGSPDLILAPAAGLVTRVDLLHDTTLGEGRWHRIATFLSVFDVHVQHVPVTGTVERVSFVPGRKVAAFRRGADLVNERNLTVLRLADGGIVGVRQIAGLVARRVVCYLEEGQEVERGEYLGIIKFGSRVDLLVPEDYEVLVAVGEHVTNGLTPMARPRQRRATS